MRGWCRSYQPWPAIKSRICTSRMASSVSSRVCAVMPQCCATSWSTARSHASASRNAKFGWFVDDRTDKKWLNGIAFDLREQPNPEPFNPPFLDRQFERLRVVNRSEIPAAYSLNKLPAAAVLARRVTVSFSTIPVYPHAAAPRAVAFNWRVALSSIAIACVYLVASWHISGPAYLRDEIGYLANAAFLAGYHIDAASSFHAGYSLLIAPAFLFSDPRVVWKAVLTINAILWAANFTMLYALLRRVLPQTQPSRLLTATIISALYPTWIISTGYAFATTAFATVFLASALALFLWSRDNPLSILPHAALTGYLYWVHPTGAAVAVVSVLAVALGAWRWRDARPLLLHVALVAALILAYQRGVHPWIVASMTPPDYAPESHYPSLASTVKILFTWHGLAVFLTMAAGQFAYFVVASFGMALAG